MSPSNSHSLVAPQTIFVPLSSLPTETEFEHSPKNVVFDIETIQLPNQIEPLEENQRPLFSNTATESGPLSPAAQWLYDQLLQNHRGTNEIIPQTEHVFDPLWDLQRNIDLFVAKNQQTQHLIFPNSLEIAHIPELPTKSIPAEGIYPGGFFQQAFDSHIPKADFSITDLSDSQDLREQRTCASKRLSNDESSDEFNKYAEQDEETFVSADFYKNETKESMSSHVEVSKLKRASASGDMTPKHKRVRMSRTNETVHGNNLYGRKGNFRCLECRKRHSRCNYTSVNLPCTYCHRKDIKSCIKVLARGIGAKIQPNKASPLAPLDTKGTISTLQCSFRARTSKSSDSKLDGEILIALSPSLQNALSAWTCRQFPAQICKKLQPLYLNQTFRALKDAISTTISEGDLFAANLLAWIHYSGPFNNLSYVSSHVFGSYLILEYLWNSSRKGRGPLSAGVKLFGPFIIDCNSMWSVRIGRLIPTRQTTFCQRVKYFDQLRRLGERLGLKSGICEALNASFGNLLEFLLQGLSSVAQLEIARDSSNQMDKQKLLDYVEAELGDLGLYQALISTKRDFQQAKSVSSVDEQWTLRLFHRLRCVLLLHSILRAPTVSEGIDSANTTAIAKAMISLLRSQSIPRGAPIRDYYLISWHNYSHLLLGGMALFNGGRPDLCLWVTQELTFIGKSDSARKLREFWETSSFELLIELLHDARYPSGMENFVHAPKETHE